MFDPCSVLSMEGLTKKRGHTEKLFQTMRGEEGVGGVGDRKAVRRRSECRKRERETTLVVPLEGRKERKFPLISLRLAMFKRRQGESGGEPIHMHVCVCSWFLWFGRFIFKYIFLS